MADEEILNRRLIQGDKIVYPITQQQNVIGLQKTITDKLPIVSPETPTEGMFVEKQVWLDTSDDDGEEVEPVVVPLRTSPALRGAKRATSIVQDEWCFPESSPSNDNEEWCFPGDEAIEETKPKEEEER